MLTPDQLDHVRATHDHRNRWFGQRAEWLASLADRVIAAGGNLPMAYADDATTLVALAQGSYRYQIARGCGHDTARREALDETVAWLPNALLDAVTIRLSRDQEVSYERCEDTTAAAMAFAALLAFSMDTETAAARIAGDGR